jgi:hypothetical protein
MDATSGADDWVLLAVAAAGHGRSAGLRDLVSCGDYINHAIFTFEELRGGLAHLLRAGLIRQTPDGWAATPAACRAIAASRRKLLKQFEAAKALIASARPQPDAPRLRGVTRKAFAAAVDDYLKDMAR